MLPIHRWPEFLSRIGWALIAPQSAAQDYRRRAERQWALNRNLNLEVHRLTGELNNVILERSQWEAEAKIAQQFGDDARSELTDRNKLLGRVEQERDSLALEGRSLTEQLEAEQSRHAETAQLLRLSRAELEVCNRIIEKNESIIQADIEWHDARSRAESQKFRGKGNQGEE